MVDQLVELIEDVAARQKAYVDRVCRGCGTPCCLRVHYVYNRTDIAFLRLSGRKRKWPRSAFLKEGCWFLGAAGCLLDPVSRPFLCHRYLCPDLENEMHGKSPGLVATLQAKFKTIEALRCRLTGLTDNAETHGRTDFS